jgi:hypothetical protein
LASGGRAGTLERLAGGPSRTLFDRYQQAADERDRGVPALPYE